MKLLLAILLATAIFSLTQGVVVSWEESLEGRIDYRFFYLSMPAEESGNYIKPYFGIVNGIEGYEYGALGSLYCPTTGLGVAVYSDADNTGENVWRCFDINVLPFAGTPTGAPSPALCPIGSSFGIPTLWNMTSHSWNCGVYNQILTFATRELPDENCVSADFLMYYEYLDEIRCVNPQNIDPSLTLQSRRDAGLELEERVDVNNDKKWHTIMSDMDVTSVSSRTWNLWRWTPHLNYDTTSGSSLISTPPQALPFSSTLIAATFASFKVSGYLFSIQPPTSTDRFTGVVTRLTTGLGEAVISSTLDFTSISATSGQVTFGFNGNANANAAPGEAFVAGIKDKNWVALPLISDRHMITVTLWIQTQQSFTAFWPLA